MTDRERARTITLVSAIVTLALACIGAADAETAGVQAPGADTRASVSAQQTGSRAVQRIAGAAAYAADPPTMLKWRVRTQSGRILGSPVLGMDGTIYFSADEGTLYAIRPDGSEQWRQAVGTLITSAPTMGTDGTLYVGGSDGAVVAIGPDGQRRWRFQEGGSVGRSPALGPDNTLYVGIGSAVIALDPAGRLLWRHATQGLVVASPAVGGDGMVYAAASSQGSSQRGAVPIPGTANVSSGSNSVEAIYPDGTLHWRYDLAGVPSGLAVSGAGAVYVGIQDPGALLELDADGGLQWLIPIAGGATRPVLRADGSIHVVSGSTPPHSSTVRQPDGSDIVFDNFGQPLTVRAVRPDGTVGWLVELSTAPGKATAGVEAATGPDGAAYVVEWNGVAEVAEPGIRRSTFSTDGSPTSAPAVGADGTVYVAVGTQLDALGLSPPRGQDPGTWTRVAQPTGTGTLTGLLDGRVLMVGGQPGDSSPAPASLYNPATRSWTSTGSLGGPRQGHTALLLRDGRVLVVGGYAPSRSVPGAIEALASTELYHPDDGRWIPAGLLSRPPEVHRALALPDGRVLVIGWQVGQQWQVEFYDAVSGHWSVGGPVPGLEYVYTATVLADGSVLVTGTVQGRSGSAARRYDPSSGAWADAGVMLALPGERQSATVLTDGRVLVVAERGGAELYLPTANRWVSTSPAGSGYWPVARLADGRVLAVGGARLGMQRTGAALFDPGSERWADTAPMTSEHPDTPGVLLADGGVIIADVNGAEIFEP